MQVSKHLLEINKQNIFNIITPNDVYEYYITNLVYNRSMSSPFRIDKNPSFTISNKTFTWIDFKTGERGDCIEFVKKLYNIDFIQALQQIIKDLGISNQFLLTGNVKRSTKKIKIENISNRHSISGEFTIKVKFREYEDYDLAYWNCYGVSIKYLKIGRIYPIKYYYINDKPYVAEKHAYCFVEKKDNNVTYKIYQPYSNNKKWINGNDYSVWELWDLIPETHEKLILTSSRKDALSIIENLHIPSCALQSESVQAKQHVVKDILKRFKTVYLLFDNDYDADKNWGQRSAEKMLKQYDFKNIILPEEYKSKDFSDLVCNYNRVTATNILKELL